METLTLVDIFFLITGSAVIIISILLAIGLIYVIMFVRTVKKVARTAQVASEGISEDIVALRKNIKDKGLGLSSLASFAAGLAKRKITRKK
jgi:hypothetical protein